MSFIDRLQPMKKILITAFLLVAIGAFSQKKPRPEPPKLVGTSEIEKTDERLGDFLIKKKKFNVYLGSQKPDSDLRQEIGDTLQSYKITLDKRKYSELEIPKFATRSGKIIAEGSFTVTNDTLTVVQNAYDYIGSYCITKKYITDKWGLKLVFDEMKGIKLEHLTDRHLKPAAMRIPLPARN